MLAGLSSSMDSTLKRQSCQHSFYSHTGPVVKTIQHHFKAHADKLAYYIASVAWVPGSMTIIWTKWVTVSKWDNMYNLLSFKGMCNGWQITKSMHRHFMSMGQTWHHDHMMKKCTEKWTLVKVIKILWKQSLSPTLSISLWQYCGITMAIECHFILLSLAYWTFTALR